MGTVVNLFTKEEELFQSEKDAGDVLKEVIDSVEFSDVIVVGYNSEGDFILRSSKLTQPEVLFLLEQARMAVMSY